METTIILLFSVFTGAFAGFMLYRKGIADGIRISKGEGMKRIPFFTTKKHGGEEDPQAELKEKIESYEVKL